MTIASLDEVDLERLSADARDALERIAPLLADGADAAMVADQLGCSSKQVNEAMAVLREELRAQKEGAVLPPLRDDDYEALRDSIQQLGQLVPIVVDDKGRPLYDDGNHRLRACTELGLEPWTVAYETSPTSRNGSGDWRRAASLAVNTARRQLTPEQRKRIVAAELLYDPTSSDRSIAARAGLSHPTVAKVRKALAARGIVESVTTRTRSDGRVGAHPPAGVEPADPPEDAAGEVFASGASEELLDGATVVFHVSAQAIEKLRSWYGPCQIRIVQNGGRYDLEVRDLS